MKHCKIFDTLMLLALGMGAIPMLWAQENEGPGSVSIRNIRVQGDACNPANSSVIVSDGGEAFTAVFDEFYIDLNGASNLQKQCRLTFDLEQTPGWQFAVISVAARGYIHLDEGVTGQQMIRFGAIGRGEKEKSVMALRGAMEQDYTHAADIGVSEISWHGCKNNNHDRVKDFFIGTSINLQSRTPNARGVLTVDSVDGNAELVYDLVWRRCGEAPGKKTVAICKAPSNSHGGMVSAKGQHKDFSKAMKKAQQELTKRCRKLGGCNMAAVTCGNIGI
jgi:hypothetical protein